MILFSNTFLSQHPWDAPLSPLCLSFRCSDNNSDSISGIRVSQELVLGPLFFISSHPYTRWPLISYCLQGRLNGSAWPWGTSHPSPTVPSNLVFCSSLCHHSSPTAYLFLCSNISSTLSLWAFVHAVLSSRWSFLLNLVSKSASFSKVQLNSHHPQETVSGNSTFQWPLPWPSQSLGHFSELFTMVLLNRIPFYNLTWLSCFSELTLNFWGQNPFRTR